MCVKPHRCPAGNYMCPSDGSEGSACTAGSCNLCAAGRYRRDDDLIGSSSNRADQKDTDNKFCLICPKGKIESDAKREDICWKNCPAGKYCGAGSYEGSSTVKDCPKGYFCPAGSSAYTSNKCAAGHYCPAKSIDKFGRSKKTDEARQCKGGYFCPSGAYTSKGAYINKDGIAVTGSRLCAAGYYCPEGATTQSVAGTFGETSGSTWTNYCPKGSSKATEIPNGWVGTGWSESRKSFTGVRKCSKGRYCHRDELKKGRSFIDGSLCAAGRSGWGEGNMYSTCNGQCPEGYYCAAGTKLQWPSPNSATTTEWSAIQCGKAAALDPAPTKRFTTDYSAKAYCPAGTEVIKYAPAEGQYTIGPNDQSGSLIGGKGVWRVDHDGNRDAYLNMRVGLMACPENYVCIFGARAPALEFITTSSTTMADWAGSDSCGGEAWSTTTSMTGTPNDAVKSQASLAHLSTYTTTNNVVTITVDDIIGVGVKSANDLFEEAIYVVTDSVGGNTLFQGVGQKDGLAAASEGVIKLFNGKQVWYDQKKNGHKTRTLTVTASRALAANPSTKIKTRKACTITVNVRNSNDRPHITKGQKFTIEEQSPLETLVQTPVEANDLDEGQSFEYSLDTDKYGGQGTYDETQSGNIIDATKLPFSIGKCSGILKVKNDVLRYDDDGTKLKSRLYTLAIKVMDQDDDYANFDKDACNEETYGVAAGAPSAIKGIYCQKVNYGTVEVEILNKNDSPYFSEDDKTTNAGFTVSENAALDTVVGTIAVSDPDADEDGKHTFKVLELDSHDGFKIDPNTGEIQVKRTLDFEDKNTYRIKVRVTDTGGWRNIPLHADTYVDITVEDANDKPSLTATLDASCDENDNGATIIGTLKVTEKDVETKWNTIDFKFSSGSSSDFSLVSSGSGASKSWALKAARDFDYETEKEIKVKVYAHDNDATSRSKDMEIIVKINDVNEAPIHGDYVIHVEENVPKRRACKQGDNTKCVPADLDSTYDMVDGGQDHTYTIETCTPGDCKSVFSIDVNSGEIKTIDSLDKETTAQYKITVKVEDDEKVPKSDTFVVTLNVDDVDEAPYIEKSANGDGTGSRSDFECTEVSEDASKDSTICTFEVQEDDTTAQFKLGTETTIQSGNEDEMFSLATNGVLTVKKTLKLDYETKKTYKLMVRTATCTKGTTGAKTLCSCKDSACSSASGYAMLKNDKEYEVTLTDANEAPEIIMDKDAGGTATTYIKREVNEESTEGTNVGKVIDCDDEDKSDQSSSGGCTATCAVVDHLDKDGTKLASSHACYQADPTAKGCFTMDGYQLEVAGGKTLPSLSSNAAEVVKVRVQCWDRSGTVDASGVWSDGVAKSDTVDMEVSIEPINETPNIDNKKCYLFENPKDGTKVCTEFGTKNIDEEVTEGFQKLTYTISKGNNKGYFKISSDKGQISVKKGDDLDYEKFKDSDGVARFTITVTVEDDDPKNKQKDTAEVDIYLLDVNEKPDKVSKFECKDQSEDSNVGDKMCHRIIYADNTNGAARKDTDPEGETNQILSFTSGNSDGIFEIDENDGQIKIAKADLDFESKKEHTLNIKIAEPRWDITSADYRGSMSTTKSGAACQRWDVQTPRKHTFAPDNDNGGKGQYNESGLTEVMVTHPDDRGIQTKAVCEAMKGTWSTEDEQCTIKNLLQGMCRDPDGEKNSIWCYTLTGDKEWEYCEENLDAEIEAKITIADTNEAPTLKVPKTEITTYEDDSNGEEIGKVFRGEDKDDGDEVTYTLEDDADGRFSIVSSTGQIKIKDESKIDYEEDEYHTIKVKVTDKGCGCKNCQNCKVKKDLACVDTDWCDEKTGDANRPSDKSRADFCTSDTYKCKTVTTPKKTAEISGKVKFKKPFFGSTQKKKKYILYSQILHIIFIFHGLFFFFFFFSQQTLQFLMSTSRHPWMH